MGRNTIIVIALQDGEKRLSPTTINLLSSFKHCVVFIFDWGFENAYDSLTSTNYFMFYSESINCALVVETYKQHRNKPAINPRFTGPYEPHPLFTKRITAFINLYSSAVTSAAVRRGSATYNIHAILKRYNIAFNFVLLFMSRETYSSAGSIAMFTSFTQVSSPAVYILSLDGHEVYVIGFGHLLQSLPYLFRVVNFQEAYIQQLHESVHKDLQQALVVVWTASSPQLCKFGSPTEHYSNECAFSELAQAFNMTHWNIYYSPCKSPRLSIIYTATQLQFDELYTRRDHINFEFISYLLANHEFSFACVIETNMLGFRAFVEAFDVWTWSVAAASCVCLTVTIAIISNKSTASWWTHLQPSCVVVVMLLIERFYEHAPLQRAASRQTVLVVTLWAFGAMLLSMSYSGNMVSELASLSLPPVPQNMHELSQVEYPIFTPTLTSELIDGKIHLRPFLHTEINVYLKANPNRNGKVVKDLQRLSMAVTFLKTSTKSAVQSEIGKGSRVLFASADHAVSVRASGLRSMINDSNLRTSSVRELPFFNKKDAMVVESNTLSQVFRKFLAKICAPGIWKQWYDIDGNIDLRDYASTNRHDMHEKTIGQSWVRRINLATIWGHFGHLVDGTTRVNPIDVDNLRPAFQLLGICLLVSTLVLCYERCPLHLILHRIFRSAYYKVLYLVEIYT